MNRTLRSGVLAVTLLGSATLMSVLASANSVHNEGYFGGSWSSIGPGNSYQRRHAGRVGPLYGGRRYYREYGPAPYAYYGGPAYDSYYYDYGPPLIGGPGIGFSIGIY